MTSFEHIKAPRVEELRQVGESYLDYGPALPEGYGRPVVRLLARDPESLFATWEGWGLLRVLDLTTGGDRYFSVSSPGSLYVSAEPEHEYEAEIGRGGGAQFVAIARSNRVRTPRRGPATSVDEEWPLTPEQAEEFRRQAGLTRIQFQGRTYGSGKI